MKFKVLEELFAINAFGKKSCGDLEFLIEVINEPRDGFVMLLKNTQGKQWNLGINSKLLGHLGRNPVIDVIRETVRQIQETGDTQDESAILRGKG